MASDETGVKFEKQRVNTIRIDCDYSLSKPFLSREDSQNMENEIKAENNNTAGKSNNARSKADYKRSLSQGASPASGRLGKWTGNRMPLLHQISRFSSPDTILNMEPLQNDLKKPKNSETCWKFSNILSLLLSLFCAALGIFFIINRKDLLFDANNSFKQTSEDNFKHHQGTASAQHHYYEGSNSIQFRINQNASNMQEKVVWEKLTGEGDQYKIDGECVAVPEDGIYIGFATLTFRYNKSTVLSNDYLVISVEIIPKLTGKNSMLLMMSDTVPPAHLRDNRRVLKPLQIYFTHGLRAGDQACIRSNPEWFLHYPSPLNNFFTLAKL